MIRMIWTCSNCNQEISGSLRRRRAWQKKVMRHVRRNHPDQAQGTYELVTRLAAMASKDVIT